VTNLGPFSFHSVLPKKNRYFFPNVVGEDRRVFHLNRSGAGIIDIERMEGALLAAGAGPMAPSYAEMTVTFEFIPDWLVFNGNGDYTDHGTGMVAIEYALDDFYEQVVDGGLGVFVDGYAHSISHGMINVNERCAFAILSGDVTVTRFIGGTVATVETTFAFPSGKWTKDTIEPNDPSKTKVYIR
jgi:hypothetical protein